MSHIWPHLPQAVALHDFDKIVAGTRSGPATRHPGQVYAPVGDRVSEVKIQALIEDARLVAVSHGYPNRAGPSVRVAFDRAMAPVIREAMDITWAEGGNRGLWSFVALVVLPDLTDWRFGTGNPERWLGSDLTRHTWARLWWQAVVFAEDKPLFNSLAESELNQLLERRSIGGDPRLVLALARTVIDVPRDGVPRRALIRDATARLRRWLAFIDARALDDDQVAQMCRSLTIQSMGHLEELKARRPDAKELSDREDS